MQQHLRTYRTCWSTKQRSTLLYENTTVSSTTTMNGGLIVTCHWLVDQILLVVNTATFHEATGLLFHRDCAMPTARLPALPALNRRRRKVPGSCTAAPLVTRPPCDTVGALDMRRTQPCTTMHDLQWSTLDEKDTVVKPRTDSPTNTPWAMSSRRDPLVGASSPAKRLYLNSVPRSPSTTS